MDVGSHHHHKRAPAGEGGGGGSGGGGSGSADSNSSSTDVENDSGEDGGNPGNGNQALRIDEAYLDDPLDLRRLPVLLSTPAQPGGE